MTWFGLLRRGLEFRELRLIVIVVFGTTAALLALVPPWSQWLPAVVVGILAWAPSEYVFHRFVLHARAPRQPWLRKLHARLHWKHHKRPDAPHLLFVPLLGTVMLLALAAAVGHAVGGLPAALGASLGASIALFFYETTHLAAHVPYVPRTRYGRFLKRFHLLHHYKNERYWFGVTHPLGDFVARTWPARDAVERSKTARTLGVDPV